MAGEACCKVRSSVLRAVGRRGTRRTMPVTEKERRVEYIMDVLPFYHAFFCSRAEDELEFDPVEDSKLIPLPPPINACCARFRGEIYLHINFVARTRARNSHWQKQRCLVFAELRFTPYVLDSFFVDTCTVLQQLPADADLTAAAANGNDCAFCPPGRVLHPAEFYCGKQQHKDELNLSIQKLKLLS
ncbi:hypothetical protein OsJ_19835 [Oryza sativa Japonica Group]|nr:hypothetical protein OsJ_19835 [Oryza sativa Japonica Group]